MRDLEGRGRQGTLRRVAVDFVGADPVLPLVPATHVAAAAGDGVPLHGLTFERVALGRPVLERPGLEIEVQRLAVDPERTFTVRVIR